MKKILVFCMSIMVALTTMAAPQKGTRAHGQTRRMMPVEHVRKSHDNKMPAHLTGEDRVINGNDLFVMPNEWFDFFWAFGEYGVLDFQGGMSDKWTVAGNLYVYDEDPAKWYGNYDPDDVEALVFDNDKADDEGTELTFTSFKYEKTAKGDQIVASATDEAGNTYSIHLTFFAPEKPNDTVKIVFKDEAYMSREDGLYYYAENNDYLVQIDLNTRKLEGTFTDVDFNKQYTGVWLIAGKDTTFTGVPFSSKTEIKLVDGVYNIEAELFASSDSILYQVSMRYTKPTAKTLVEVLLKDALMEDYTEDYGTVDMQAAPADSSYLISLSTYTEKIEGSYTDSDLDLYYSFMMVGTKYYDIFEAEFTISSNGDGTYTYTGWLLATNSVKYEFVIKTSPIQGVEILREGNVATKHFENGQLIIEKNGAKYNVIGTKVQ